MPSALSLMPFKLVDPTANNAPGTGFTGTSFTPTNGRVQIGWVFSRITSASATPVQPTWTQNGHAWTVRSTVTAQTGTFGYRLTTFWLAESSAGAGGPVISFGAETEDQAIYGAFEWANTNTTSPFAQSDATTTQSTAQTSITATLSAYAAAYDMGVCIMAAGAASSYTPGSGQNLIAKGGSASSTNGSACVWFGPVLAFSSTFSSVTGSLAIASELANSNSAGGGLLDNEGFSGGFTQ